MIMKFSSYAKRLFQQNRNIKLMSVILVLIVALLGIRLYHHKNNLQEMHKQHAKMLLQKVNNIQSDIQLLSTNINHTEVKHLFEAVEKSLNETQQSIVVLAKSSNMQTISTQIASLKDEIEDTKKLILHAEDSKEYLNVDALPFHVFTIDVISGEPYVTIGNNSPTLTLAISDSIAGWRLIAADYELGFAEFMNIKHQYVKVTKATQ